MYNEDSRYYNFLLNSILYDKDYIASFFGLENKIWKNIPNLEDEDNEILKNVSAKLEDIVLNDNGFRFKDPCDKKNEALKSIFTTFKKHKEDKELNNIKKELNNIKYYPLSILNNVNVKENKIIYPDKSRNSFEEDYKKSFYNDINNIIEDINNKIINDKNLVTILNTKVNGILNALSNIFSYVPYFKNGECGIGDISFYDKLKINTALSSCLYLLKEKNELDKSSLNDGNYNHFVLLSGDISGIQKFIYTISSKGALKSLRARSFYLEIMLEHIADEILEYFHLTRANLLYTGGGHFYIILPNYKTIGKEIDEIMYKLNDWFIEHFSIDLYIAMGIGEFSFKDLENFASVFKKLSVKLTEIKQRRYFYEDNKYQLIKLLNPKDNIEKEHECSICHTSFKSTQKRDGFSKDSGDEVYSCDTCFNLYRAGKYILSENKSIFVINSTYGLDNKDNLIVDLPSLSNETEKSRYLCFGKINEKENSNLVRVYSKNNNSDKHINLFLGDYNFKESEESTDLIDFETLVKGTENNSTVGIKRLAVLRCDVDSLGDAFMNGFRGHADILRTSSFSRHLSLFFKYYINCVCFGDIAFENKKLFIDEYFNKDKYFNNKKKRIVIVYSGGDDVFLVGHWLDVINFTSDLRKAFGEYTNNKLTFSAGIGFFHTKYPVSKMASQTGELEDLAKKNKNGKKDSVALFGIPHEDKSAYVFEWEEFDNIKETIGFLFSVCYFSKDGIDKKETHTGKEKVFLSSSMMYRLKQLIELSTKDKDMNIARLAYSLARIRHNDNNNECYNEFKDNIYNWFTSEDKKDIKYFNIALDLIIYLFREE